MKSPIALALLVVAIAVAQPVEIVNEYGGVSVEVVDAPDLKAWRSGGNPDKLEAIALRQLPDRLLIEGLPPENHSPDILVEVPFGERVSVETKDGDIVLTGMLRRATVRSFEGALTVAVPLDVTALRIESLIRPKTLNVHPGRRWTSVRTVVGSGRSTWAFVNGVDAGESGYNSFVRADLDSPRALTVRDWPIPENWPVRPHSHVRAAIDRLLASANRRRESPKGTRGIQREHGAVLGSPEPSTDDVLFTADVRMVSMSVAVSDSGGRPLPGLTKENFRVEEDGRTQDIRVVTAEESPFNLAILLDLTGSTSVDLDHMRQATLRLIGIAGPNDRVALYAMAGRLFCRLARLTSDKKELTARANGLPYPQGGSPLWDTITLAYDEELADCAGERNALIVISDGIDSRISGHAVPSMLSASRLIDAAGEMDARIYPIFLHSGRRFGRNWSNQARQRLEALAAKTGGRLFPAESIADIEPVIPRLVEELRSVYGVAYYPANQVFDRSWRRVRIQVDLPGAQVRARPGYFAE